MNPTPKLFLLSGLGADGRLFNNLDLSGNDVVAINWITPEKHDSLTTYATKLIAQFGIKAGDNVMGVSLGGMMTVEIAKQVKLNQAIIISSIKSKTEFPAYFRFFRALPIYRVLSGGILQKMGPVIKPLFGHFAGSEDSELFYAMLKDSDPEFLTWAMDAVLAWAGEPAPCKINHILGTADLVFYSKKIKDVIIIPKGDHVMVFTRAEEISRIIQKILKDEAPLSVLHA
jgi:pimeloyl-ACP methyl ester carboxylesterase